MSSFWNHVPSEKSSYWGGKGKESWATANLCLQICNNRGKYCRIPCVCDVRLETNKEKLNARVGGGPGQLATVWQATKWQKGKKRKNKDSEHQWWSEKWKSNTTIFRPSKRVIASRAGQRLEKQLLPDVLVAAWVIAVFLEGNLAVAVEIENTRFYWQSSSVWGILSSRNKSTST